MDEYAPTLAAVADVLAGRPPGRPGVDWPAFRRMVVFHGLAGLVVADARTRPAGPGMPDSVLAQLEPTFFRVGLHTTLVLESAERARSALTERGIDSLLFKGAALHRAHVYEAPGARPMADADLLVPPEAAGAAVRALEEVGFEPWAAWREGRSRWASSFSLSDAAAEGEVAPALDLHWATPYTRLRTSVSGGLDPLWEGADRDLGLPAAEPHFVVLAEHFLKHLRVVTHLRGIADLARLAPALEDGARLRRQAEERGSLRGVRIVTAFLREHLGVSPSEAVVTSLGVPSLAGRPARRLRPERLFSTESPRRTGVAGVLADASLIAPLPTALGELLRVVAPPGTWLRARYGTGEGPFGRRLRYLRDLWRWARGRGPSPLSPNQGLET